MKRRSVSRFGAVLAAFLLGLGSSVMPNAQTMPHLHDLRELPDSVVVPAIQLALYKDDKSGFNLHIQIEHYELEPPEQSELQASGIVQGHAHLFINGKKFSRVYAPYLHIPAEALLQGMNGLTVTLNDHSHSVWTKDGRQLLATVFVDTRPENPQIHYFSSTQSKP